MRHVCGYPYVDYKDGDYVEEDGNDNNDGDYEEEEDGNDDSDEDCWRRLWRRWDTWPTKQRDHHQPEPSSSCSSTNTRKH